MNYLSRITLLLCVCMGMATSSFGQDNKDWHKMSDDKSQSAKRSAVKGSDPRPACNRRQDCCYSGRGYQRNSSEDDAG